MSQGAPEIPNKAIRNGRTLHVSVSHELMERVDKVLEKTDFETYSQLVRVGLKRLCEQVEDREKKMADLNPS